MRLFTKEQTIPMALRLVENRPLETRPIAALLADRYDLYLVWPHARWPFDHAQWRKALDPEAGRHAFLVCDRDRPVGHAALVPSHDPAVYSLCFLYLLPEIRSRGRGGLTISLLEHYARQRLCTARLLLRVLAHNLQAVNCYRKCGFQEYGRAGRLIKMSKELG